MSSSKIKFYIHPGLPKTASSFLEKLVFTQLKDKGWSFNDQHLLSVLKESLLKEKNDSQNLLQYLSKKKESNYLISYDALCGDPYASFEDRAAILNAISNLTNGLEIKILLTIRNQSDWVESIYKQSLHEYYYTPFNKFISWKSNRKKVPYPSLNIQCLNWYSLYCDLNKIAESKNICVLPLELMKKETERFIDIMGIFIL